MSPVWPFVVWSFCTSWTISFSSKNSHLICPFATIVEVTASTIACKQAPANLTTYCVLSQNLFWKNLFADILNHVRMIFTMYAPLIFRFLFLAGGGPSVVCLCMLFTWVSSW